MSLSAQASSFNQSVGIARSNFAMRKKGLNTFINDIRAQGASAFDVKLPRIAFIGNQSAGKSSIIEAISGVSELKRMKSFAFSRFFVDGCYC
jgi:GTP-binding protein EngB required for normal cell division